MILLLGEGGAHTSPEQSEEHHCRLQLLWQCLCSHPSREIQFSLSHPARFVKRAFLYPLQLWQEYSNWETDEVITKELFRNLGIALACVFLTTLALLANFTGSLIVLFCVAITLVFAIFRSEVTIVKQIFQPNFRWISAGTCISGDSPLTSSAPSMSSSPLGSVSTTQVGCNAIMINLGW